MPLDRRAVLGGLAAGALAGCSASGSRAARTAPAGRDTVRPTASAASGAASGAASPDAPGPGPGLPFQLDSGPRGSTGVALTFHGQGDPALATALLSEAERGGARVTVLAVGTWLDAQPRMARRVLDGGHELGNHTLHHQDISAMSARAAFAEITGCAERLRRLTGSPGRWFRPSQARDCTLTVAAQARRAGYRHALGYDLDSLDWTDPGAAAVERTVLAALHPGAVVSLHLGHPGTVAALPAVLDGLHRRGLRAVTASELFA